MSFRFQFRRGTTAERNASNPILAAGEPAVVLDSGQPAELVLGDGVTAMADLPYTMSSDAGHEMAKGRPFAACYWDTPEGRVFSLRSNDEGIDVSEVAKQYGGGGHRNASGFRVSFAQAQAFEV